MDTPPANRLRACSQQCRASISDLRDPENQAAFAGTITYPLASPTQDLHYPPRNGIEVSLAPDFENANDAMRGPWALFGACGHCAFGSGIDGARTLRLFLLGSLVFAVGGCVSTAPVVRGTHAGLVDASAAQSELIRQDFSARLTAGQAVAVDNPYGDVRLRFGGYEDQLEIHAVAQRPNMATPIALQPAIVDGIYSIAPRLPANTLVADGQRLDLVVFVPLGHPVNARTERGVIESRGIRAGIDLRSTSGNISIRGTKGQINAETGPGMIEASLLHAPRGSRQHFATSTGSIVLAVNDDLDANLELSTSAAFATEYSLQIEQLPGKEPNKRATARIGEGNADVVVESRRGEIRLLRWTGFRTADGKPVEEDE